MAGKAREIIKLSLEDKTNIEQTLRDMEAIEDAIAALKEMGMDTSALEEQMAWAKKTSEVLLKEFG